MKKTLSILVILFICLSNIKSQNGSLDNSYNSIGIVTTSTSSDDDIGNDNLIVFHTHVNINNNVMYIF